MNILVVEDNDVDAEILRRALSKMDKPTQLVRARNGHEALELLTRQNVTNDVVASPFFVLLDINMPGMNGHEFLENLRQSPDISDARVIYFSTSRNENDVARAYRNKAAGYLVKPDNREDLIEMLSNLRSFWFSCEHPPGSQFH